MSPHFGLLSILILAAPACGDEEQAGPPADVGTASEPDAGGAPGGGIPPERFDQIVTLFNTGVGLMERYQPVDAVKAFDEVVRLAPDWVTGRLNLGIALLNAQSDENYARAEVELRRLLELDPGNPYGHYALGMLMRHLTRFDEARGCFERVLEIDPDDADAHYQLGILIMNDDPEAARAHLETTLARIPHHESACYRLAGILRESGDAAGARALLDRFRALKKSHAGVTLGMKYGEMGRYAEVIRAFAVPAAVRLSPPPAFTDEAMESGLHRSAPGAPGWPGESAGAGPEAFAPGVAVADLDGDGDLDLCITGGADGGIDLYRNEGRRFVLVGDSGVEVSGAIGAFLGDYDRDGDPDLYVTCDGPNRLFRNERRWRFIDATETTGTAGGRFTSVGAAWADADHDGDLDLFVANFGRSGSPGAASRGAPNALWRNNGDGTFLDVAPGAGIDSAGSASTGVLFLDADGDHDLDLYVVNDRSPNQLFLNQRIGEYTDSSPRFSELADSGPGLGAALGDVDLNGLEDLLLLRGPAPPRLFLQVERGAFIEDPRFPLSVDGLDGAVGGLLGDLDLDGDLDLVLPGALVNGKAGHRILMNDGTGGFQPPVLLGAETGAPLARGAVAADFNGDGALALLIARAGNRPELWTAPPPGDRHWLQVAPAMKDTGDELWADPAAVGLLVEVKTGSRLQLARLSSSAGYLGGQARRVHFGLGTRGKADYVRLVWPDAVLQSELEITGSQLWRINKVVRKPSSCPLLFTWNGERFVFVTDFLGVGGLGFFITPGEYAQPDPTEDVHIPRELLATSDGRYLLRVAEPLEEVTYLDELHLIAYDHPAGVDVYPDERFSAAPPFATGRPIAVAERIFPVAARNDRGENLLERILTIDRRYAEPPRDPRFLGYARDHWIELDFGGRLRQVDPGARLVLFLYGWTEYTYSHVNYAAWQAGVGMRSPQIEVPDGSGGWRVAVPDAGFPAGLPRMMTLDISGLPFREDGRLRIRTNMEVYWDQVFAGEDVSSPQLEVHELKPVVAALRSFGYPREYSPDGSDPTLYDYHRLDQGVPFKNISGDFTPFGDVRELLGTADDGFVIMARGEEIALEFDAAALPPLPAGWTRTLVLHADGFCKDMDLYTAFPDTLAPLPYHGMENYPPPEPAPELGERVRSLRACNTRRLAGD